MVLLKSVISVSQGSMRSERPEMAIENERERRKSQPPLKESLRSSVNETGDFTPTGSLPSAPMNKIQSLGSGRQPTISARLKLSQNHIYSLLP